MEASDTSRDTRGAAPLMLRGGTWLLSLGLTLGCASGGGGGSQPVDRPTVVQPTCEEGADCGLGGR